MVLRLVLVALLCGSSAHADEGLIGGREVPLSEYPEIVYIKQGQSRCSATVIGKRVVLTAAHCVPDQGEIGPVGEPVEVEVANQRFIAKCRQAPAYRDRRGDHDMALCKADRDLPVRPAAIAARGPRVGERVLLTGYGCVRSPGTGGNDGRLRIGLARVEKLAEGADRWFYTRGSVALCYGDSGSSAQRLVSKGQVHQILGVNSRGDIRELSLLTSLAIPESLAFLRSFAAEQAVQICGISSSC